MVCVTAEISEGVFTRRVRITAPSIERALKIAGQGKPGRLRPLLCNVPDQELGEAT